MLHSLNRKINSNTVCNNNNVFCLPHTSLACQQLALAGAVVFWYFRKPTDSPVLTAIGKLLKYHLGSAAKGSILITLFKIPRLILTYLYAK